MSDIKSTISRVHAGRADAAGSAARDHTIRRPQISLPKQPERDVGTQDNRNRLGETANIAEFIAPPGETTEWLGNPAMTSVLAAVSKELAPDGVATSERNQYVASVVETHLVARRQLAKHLNALLRA